MVSSPLVPSLGQGVRKEDRRSLLLHKQAPQHQGTAGLVHAGPPNSSEHATKTISFLLR